MHAKTVISMWRVTQKVFFFSLFQITWLVTLLHNNYKRKRLPAKTGRAFCVLDFRGHQSVISVQRHFEQSLLQIHPVCIQFLSGTQILRKGGISVRENQMATHQSTRKQWNVSKQVWNAVQRNPPSDAVGNRDYHSRLFRRFCTKGCDVIPTDCHCCKP